jgi:hypothetical protein
LSSKRKGEQFQVAYISFSNFPLISSVIYTTTIYLVLFVPLQVWNSAYTNAKWLRPRQIRWNITDLKYREIPDYIYRYEVTLCLNFCYNKLWNNSKVSIFLDDWSPRYQECKRYPKTTQISATIQTYRSGNPTWTFLGLLLIRSACKNIKRTSLEFLKWKL